MSRLCPYLLLLEKILWIQYYVIQAQSVDSMATSAGLEGLSEVGSEARDTWVHYVLGSGDTSLCTIYYVL